MASLQFPIRSTFILVLIVHLAAFTNLSAYERIPYISPGIKIGWDSERGFTMGPKVGIDIAGLADKFLNLTIGIKSFQTSISDNSKFVFLDLQIGTTFRNDPWLAYGGGLGLLFGKEEGEYKIVPRTTVFLGFIFFPTLDFNFWSEEKISYEPGFELTLPIPLKKVDFGLE